MDWWGHSDYLVRERYPGFLATQYRKIKILSWEGEWQFGGVLLIVFFPRQCLPVHSLSHAAAGIPKQNALRGCELLKARWSSSAVSRGSAGHSSWPTPSILKAVISNYQGKTAWVSWFTLFFPLQILKFHFPNCGKLMLQGFAGTEPFPSHMSRACKVESMGEGEAPIQGIPLTFCSVGQNSAASARSLLESNSFADSRVQEALFSRPPPTARSVKHWVTTGCTRRPPSKASLFWKKICSADNYLWKITNANPIL